MELSLAKKTTALTLPLIIILLGFPQISETIYTPALPQLAHDLATSSQWAEFTLSIYFIGFALGVALWGFCCDMLGRRKPMLIGLTVYAISCVLLWQAHSIHELLFWRFFQAVGASAGSVVTQTMIRDVFEGKRRHQVFAIAGGAIAFSPAIGPWLGGFLCTAFGWQMNFALLAAVGLSLFAHCWFFLPETRTDNGVRNFSGEAVRRITWRMVSDKWIAVHVLLIAACNGIVFGFYGEAPFLFIELMQFTPSEYGLLGIVVSAAGIAAAWCSHHMNEFYKPQQIISLGATCALVGAVSLLIVAWKGLFHPGPNLLEMGYIILSIGLTFFGISLVISNSLSIALSHYKDTLGVSGAIFGVMYYIGIAAFTALMSLIHNGTAYPMPLLFIGLALTLVFSSWKVAR